LYPGTITLPPGGGTSKDYLTKVDIFVKYGGKGAVKWFGDQKYHVSSAKLKIYGPKSSFSTSMGSLIATSEANVSSPEGWHYETFQFANSLKHLEHGKKYWLVLSTTKGEVQWTVTNTNYVNSDSDNDSYKCVGFTCGKVTTNGDHSFRIHTSPVVCDTATHQCVY
jgi:hypothetical protein